MEEFKVSVVIPVFNGAAFLEATVRSTLIHAVVYEVLLIEDGSTDDSMAVCEKLCKLDKRIRLLTHPQNKNRGAAYSKNFGILMAKSEFIAFLDQDDIYLPLRFQLATELYQKGQLYDGLCEPVLEKNIHSQRSKLFGILGPTSSEQLFRHLLNGGYFHTAGITVKKTLLLRAGLFEQRYWPHDDSMLWLKLAWYGKIEISASKEPVALYLKHDHNNIYMANGITMFRLWSGLLKYFFLKPVGLGNRLLLLKRNLKYFYKVFAEFIIVKKLRDFKS